MFLISQPELVVACCKSGIVGTFPSLNCRTSEELENWITQINACCESYHSAKINQAPFGVNLIVHKTNTRLQEDLAVCIKHKVPIVITSLGANNDVVAAVHSYGGIVFHDVINTRHAQKAIGAGVDGLILVSVGAGGHGGFLNPISFLREIRQQYNGILLLAGGLTTGQDIASALQIGADLAYIGTRFINSLESNASDAHRRMIIDCNISDITNTAAVTGIRGNYLHPSLVEAGLSEEDIKYKIGFKSYDQNNKNDAKAWKNIWSAGQGVGSISDIKSTPELIDCIEKEFKQAVAEQLDKTSTYL